MVLVTGWILLRWLQRMLRRKQEQVPPQEKMRSRLNLLLTDYRPARLSDQLSEDVSGFEESVLCQELRSVQAVMEMRSEEVRRLRKELDMMEMLRDDRGVQTGIEIGKDRMASLITNSF